MEKITEFRHSSLMFKAAALLVVLILPFNLIGLITAVLSYRDSRAQMESMISYTMDSYAAALAARIDNTTAAFYELTTGNSDLQTMCTTDSETDYILAKGRLIRDSREQFTIANAADEFFGYSEHFHDYIAITGYTAATVGTAPYLSYMTDYDSSYNKWFLSDDGSTLLCVYHNSYLRLYYGAAFDLGSFLSGLDGLGNFQTLEVSFSSQPMKASASRICFSSPVTDSVYLNASIRSAEFSSSISFLRYLFLLFFVLALALIPLLIVLMRRYVGNPLDELNAAHGELEKGNEDYRIAASGNSSEFAAAYHSFNSMASSLQNLHHEVMEKELSNKQLQIDFLQLQIRPHFLLNSFNVLYTLIQRGQRESAQDMVLFLSEYFRYLFRSGRKLQLFSKELKLIEEYMDITRISYPDSFEVSYQIDPVISLMRVPPLLLHSFMENIIAHALLPDRQIHIVFSGEFEEGVVTFYISDDGKGMDAEAVDAINHVGQRSMDDGRNVGIKNSVQRLKYYYGEEATMECDSEPNVGTTFTIRIPYNLEED